jgi:hypothetical protein
LIAAQFKSKLAEIREKTGQLKAFLNAGTHRVQEYYADLRRHARRMELGS